MGRSPLPSWITLPVVLVTACLSAVAPGAEPEREAAEWIVGKQGTLTFGVAGQKGKRPLKPGEALPLGRLTISQVGLRGAAIGDDDLRRLATITSLERLDLFDTPITDVGLAHLTGLRSLQMLNLQQTKVTDAGLKHLVGMPKLRDLNLFQTQISNEGLKQLASLTSLEALNLEATLVNDDGLPTLAPLVKLENLALSNTVVTDAGLAAIAKMTSLKKLAVNFSSVSNAGIPQLAKLQSLTTLNVNRSFVTAAGYAKLQQTLPNCKIIWNSENVQTGAPLKPTTASDGVRVARARATLPTSIESFCQGPLPPYLSGAVIYGYSTATRTNDPAFGRVEVTFERDMNIAFAATWTSEDREGDAPGAWTAERKQYHQFLRSGWLDIGLIRFNDVGFRTHSLLWKPCRRGETLVLRTQQFQPPLVIVPLVSAPSPLDGDPYATWQGRIADNILASRLRRMLRHEKFAELEAIVAQIRREKTVSLEGRSRLSVFYEATRLQSTAPDEWPEDRALLERWLAAYPQSVAAHIASAQYWGAYARAAHGLDPAQSQERDAKAREFVRKGYLLSEKDPMLCRLELSFATDDGATPAEVEKIIEQSLLIDTAYTGTAREAVRYYLPSRYGKRGDLEAFAARIADRTRSRWGDSLYTYIVMDTANYRSSAIFEDFDFDWPRVKRGFVDLRKRFPKGAELAAANVRFAGYRHDRPEAEAALSYFNSIRPASFFLDNETESFMRWAAPDYLSGEQTAVYEAGGNSINRVEWTIDGGRWVVLDNASVLSVFDASNGKRLSRAAANAERPRFSALVPFGKTLVTAEWDDNVVVYQVPSGSTRRLGQHKGMRAAALSTDGTEWATAGNDKKIKFWNLAAPEGEEQTPDEWDSTTLIRGLAYVPNSRTIAIGGDDKRIGFWNRDTKEKSVDLTPRKGGIESMRISPDGDWLAVVDSKELTLWRLKEFELAATIPHGGLWFHDLAFSRDGKYLAAGVGEVNKDGPGRVMIWSTADGTERHHYQGHKDTVRSVSFSPEGDKLISASDDMTLRIWKVE